MSGITFPNESPEYRRARNEVLAAEMELRRQTERVAAKRRALPPGGKVKTDYVFRELGADGSVRDVPLSRIFADDRDTLFVYSWMFGPDRDAPCPMCSSILDALDGNAPHIARRIDLAVVAKAPIERMVAFARTRGWRHLRLLSSSGNSFNADYHGEDGDGNQMPMANVFVRRDGVIRHFWGSELLYAQREGDPRHMDPGWPLWNVLDATPAGRGDWYPSLEP